MQHSIVRTMAVLTLGTFLGVSVAAQAPQGGQGAPGGAPGAGAPRQGGPGGPGGGRGGGRGGFNLVPILMETDAFPDGGIVPAKYSANGGNTMPGFKITNIPETATSLAIIFHDVDVALGGGTDDVLHWMAWNIPAKSGGWSEGKLPEGSVEGLNMRKQNSYMGPGAPAGPRYHHYVFELYALNANLDLAPTSGRVDLLKAMEGKVVAKAAYVGRFRSDPPEAK